MCRIPVAILRSREGFISFLKTLASITLRGVLMSFIQSCFLLTSETCAEGWAPFLYRGLSCLPGIGRLPGSAMATGAQGVSTVVQGTENADYPTMRGSAARVPLARVVTTTCTKEVRSSKGYWKR